VQSCPVADAFGAQSSTDMGLDQPAWQDRLQGNSRHPSLRRATRRGLSAPAKLAPVRTALSSSNVRLDSAGWSGDHGAKRIRHLAIKVNGAYGLHEAGTRRPKHRIELAEEPPREG
jgi:hypothetical protein